MKILLKILLSVLLFYSNIFCADMDSDFSDAFVNPPLLQELGINDDDELQDDEWQDSDDDLTPRERFNQLIRDINSSTGEKRNNFIEDLWYMYKDAQDQHLTRLAYDCYKALVKLGRNSCFFFKINID